jgi:hypothetical protein
MKRAISAFLGITLLIFPFSSSVAQDLSMEARAAFHYLNLLRTKAGMIPFEWNPVLERSSANHAAYLSKNNLISHVENPDRVGFTGTHPDDRALREGYNAKVVTENHSTGDGDSMASVDGLMGAIYHRFGFLDFSQDEIGIALNVADRGYNVVYNMGNTSLNRYCEGAATIREGHYYQGFCKHADKVAVEPIDNLERKTKKKNPDFVVWPPNNGTDIPVVFYEEIPDPLPGISVSGYPISIQFNSSSYSHINMLSFTLYEQTDDGVAELERVHLMQKSNDPHQKFTDKEFALFPLNRLDWGKAYYAAVRYQHEGQRFEYEWQFSTKKLQHPMFKIAAAGESLKMVSDKTYFIYVPPKRRFPFIQQLGVESPYSIQVNVDWEDRNTVKISLSGQNCQPSKFQLDGGRSFSVTLAPTDNQNTQQRYPTHISSPCN